MVSVIGGGKMTKAEANEEAKKLAEWCSREEARITQEAKESGAWTYGGLDTNRHLFEELRNETRRRLAQIRSQIDT